MATVQNRYNLTDTRSTDVLDYCEQQGIAFLPWAPISAGELAAPGGPVATVAERLGATPSQVALAWLLRRSPVMVPIPGTGSVAHLEENMAAAELELDDAAYAADQRGRRRLTRSFLAETCRDLRRRRLPPPCAGCDLRAGGRNLRARRLP